MNPFRMGLASYGQTLGQPQPVAGGGFNEFAAGKKHYGGGRAFPTSGSVNHAGYARRDNEQAARRNAMLSRLQNQQAGNFQSPSVLRPKGY